MKWRCFEKKNAFFLQYLLLVKNIKTYNFAIFKATDIETIYLGGIAKLELIGWLDYHIGFFIDQNGKSSFIFKRRTLNRNSIRPIKISVTL